MQLFNCPWCGPRDQSEFTYGREVAPIPALDAPAADWYSYVYERDNPSGPHAEWWHHNLGCRQWLKIVRDTVTHNVSSIDPARQNWGQTPISKSGSDPNCVDSGSPANEGQTPIVAPTSPATSPALDPDNHER